MICSTCRQPNPDEAPTCCGCGVALPSTAASPPVTSAVLDNRSITGGQWIRTRFVPIVLGAVIVGALLGMARGAMNAVFFGIQGMLVGGGGGFLATRFGRSDPERFWSIGQRFWLGVGVMLAFTTANLVAASAAHAGPLDQGDDYRGMPETIVSVALGVIPSGSENRSTHCKSKLSTRRNCIAWPDSGPSSVYTNSPKRPLRSGRCFRT